MLIQNPCVVSLTWRLEDTMGHLIHETSDSVELFYGGDDVLPMVQDALLDQEKGFTTELHLEPEHAFGEYDSKLVFFESRSIFGEDIAAGMQFEGPPEGSMTPDLPADTLYTVTEVYPDHVVLDGNHPLAGIALRLTLSVEDVRPASHQEMQTGSMALPALSVVVDPGRAFTVH